MSLLVARCRCGQAYQKFDNSEWDRALILAWCHQCVGTPWHNAKTAWSAKATELSASRSQW